MRYKESCSSQIRHTSDKLCFLYILSTLHQQSTTKQHKENTNIPPMATTTFPLPSLPSLDNAKKKRRPAGTPDPEAEVISLSPQTLLETDRYTCEICNQGFQREQNLQMHRRRHKVPWKLLKRESTAATKNGEGRKRVYVCPEPSCLHHDPSHALGDLVGIKKHFRRKHSDRRQWVCQKCDKGYAVQSDYKAHLKTCGTRGHTCDCGRVFSRVESFIEHQDTCDARRRQPACLSRTASSPSPSTDTDSNAATANFTLELQLLPPSTSCHPTTTKTTATTTASADTPATQLQLSLALASGSSDNGDRENLQDQLRLAAAEKALADAARQQAKRQLELAQQEFANAKRIRLQAQAELDKAFILRDNATKSIDSILFQVTCHECRQRLRPEHVHVPRDDNSLAVSAVTVGERSRISV